MTTPRPQTAEMIQNSTEIPTCMVFETPLGHMTVASSRKGLRGAWFDGQKHHPDTRSWPHDTAHAVLREARRQIDAYFDSRLDRFDLPLDVAVGTPWQQEVWNALRAIRSGETRTYGQLAELLGRAGAARAVGTAVGRNPWSIIVPCHRVLGTSGQLTGYAGGLHRKQALLALEARP